MLSAYLVALFIFLGIIFILVEIIFVPGLGLPGIAGALLIILGIYIGFEVSTKVGLISLVAGFIAFIALALFAFREKTWSKLSVKGVIGSRNQNENDIKLQIGQIGNTMSRLSPIGKGIFDGEIYEVRSTGEFVDENTEIRIKSIKGIQITVEKLN